MGTHSVQSAEDFFEIQERLSQGAIDAMSFNFETLIISAPDRFDSEIVGAISSTEGGAPVPVLDLSAMVGRLSALETRMAVAETPSPRFAFTASESVIRRRWIVADEPIMVSESNDGFWSLAAHVDYQRMSGRGVGVRIKLNGDVIASQSVDGNGGIPTTVASVAAGVSLSVGDVITFEIAQNFTSRVTLNFSATGVRVSS